MILRIEIRIGGDACSTAADVGLIVVETGLRIQDLATDIPGALPIKDLNGNRVGTLSYDSE